MALLKCTHSAAVGPTQPRRIVAVEAQVELTVVHQLSVKPARYGMKSYHMGHGNTA